MAADVSSLVRILNGHLDEQRSQSSDKEEDRRSRGASDLLTKDLLGSSASCSSFSSSRLKSKDVDLDLQVPSGWEKRLDLKSGKVYLQRCNSPISSSSTMTTSSERKPGKEPQSSNLLAGSSPTNTNLELKLVPSYDYQNVCTLDKVKSALERAEKEESAKKRQLTISISSDDEEEEERSSLSSSGLLFAGGCPGCLMYVMISKANPRCPRCDSIVPCPGEMGVRKKVKLDLDLNLSLLPSSP